MPLPPGSGMDLSARLAAERLSERWGQPVVVENRQGADGIPAVTAFLSARDNHTFLFSFAGIVTFNHLLHEKLPYDPKELIPIVPVIDNYLGVSATTVLKVNSLAEFVQTAKAQPSELNWAATPGLPYYVLLACRSTLESRWCKSPTVTLRPPTRISIRAACMSSAPAFRPWCRIIAPAPPGSCSSPTATVRPRPPTCRPRARRVTRT